MSNVQKALEKGEAILPEIKGEDTRTFHEKFSSLAEAFKTEYFKHEKTREDLALEALTNATIATVVSEKIKKFGLD